jgi:hypothetical protein
VADEEKPKKKHTPGRGHRRKSDPRKQRRFKMNMARKQKEAEELARRLWQRYDQLPDEAKKLLGSKGKPKLPRPKDER